tara:strand:+ start:1547 stop:2710 length:1164 start_codon:yes stop_codon:yes gene_type:complete
MPWNTNIWSNTITEEQLDIAIQTEQTAQSKEVLRERIQQEYDTILQEVNTLSAELETITASSNADGDVISRKQAELQVKLTEKAEKEAERNTVVAEAQQAIAAAVRHSSLLNSCNFANDDVCDELICAPNTDTDDCNGIEVPSDETLILSSFGSIEDMYSDVSGDKVYTMFDILNKITKNVLSEKCDSKCSSSDIDIISDILSPVFKDRSKSMEFIGLGIEMASNVDNAGDYFNVKSYEDIKNELIELNGSCEECIINNTNLNERTCENIFGVNSDFHFINDYNNNKDLKYNCPSKFKDKSKLDEIKCSSDKDCNKTDCCDKKVSGTSSSLIFGGGTSFLFSFCCCICIVVFLFVALRFWLINKSLEGMGMKSTKQKISAVAFHKMI